MLRGEPWESQGGCKVGRGAGNLYFAISRKEENTTAKFVLRQDGKDRYLILFQTHAGQVLLTREARYKDIALRLIDATRTLAMNRKNYELHTLEAGRSYFSIKNRKGEVLALSETYPDPESMLQGINQVKGAVRGARLEDLTPRSS